MACNVKTTKPVLIEYPELDQMITEGWEISDTLPPWGSGNVYFQTFLMQRQVKKASQSRSK